MRDMIFFSKWRSRKFFDKYSSQTRIEMSTLRFLYDETRLCGDDTPEMVDTEDGDVVDVHVEQGGC